MIRNKEQIINTLRIAKNLNSPEMIQMRDMVLILQQLIVFYYIVILMKLFRT